MKNLKFKQLFGAHLDGDDKLAYTSDSSDWFDLSLISAYGRQEADRLKLLNRRTYQELIFAGLGLGFNGEPYYLPPSQPTGLEGHVAISATAGAVWPMKKWAYYEELKNELELAGLTVNVLQTRPTLLEHLADVQGHRCLVSGDSLPMHLALGSGCDASPFSPAPVHGKYTDTGCNKGLYPQFSRSFSTSVITIKAQRLRSVLSK